MSEVDTRGEAVRNRTLRRADWRFLLPTPCPSKVACFADGLLAQAVRAISQHTVDARVERPPGDCDLAVAVEPDEETLRAAWAAVHPGGSCYTEWVSPGARGPQTIRKRLEAAGFEQVTCYCARGPSRTWAEVWLPLESPAVLRYFLRNRPPARGIARRLGLILRQLRWLLSQWIPVVLPAPVSAIARKPSVSGAPGQISPSPVSVANHGPLTETIRARWHSWGFGPTPDRLSWLLLTRGFRSQNKVAALVFAGSAREPSVAVKMPRLPESASGFLNEARTLQALHARPGGVSGVPKFLFLEEHCGILSLGETAVSGQQLYHVVRHDNYPGLARKATGWLAELAGRGEPCPPSLWWNRLVAPVFRDFESSFGPVLDQGMLRETWDILSTLGPMPLVCEQRDFSQWNVLITRSGELAVLDWESSELHGLPALDLIYFLSYIPFSLDAAWGSPERIRQTYRATLDPTSPTGAVAQQCLSTYADRTGLSLSNLRPLRLLVWMLHSRSEYGWFTADVGGRPGPDVLRRSFFAGLWEEELRHGSCR